MSSDKASKDMEKVGNSSLDFSIHVSKHVSTEGPMDQSLCGEGSFALTDDDGAPLDDDKTKEGGK